MSVSALLSALFGMMFIQYVGYGPDLLTSTSTEDFIFYLSKMDVVWILTSMDFWTLPHWQLLLQKQGLEILLNIFSGISLAIFCTGLLIYNIYLNKLPKEYISLLFLIMGWAHVVLSKIVLTSEPPTRLVGPVLAVGIISLIYFSLTALLFPVLQAIWGRTK